MFLKKKKPQPGDIIYISFSARMYATALDMFLMLIPLLPLYLLGANSFPTLPPELAQEYVNMGKGLVTPHEFNQHLMDYLIQIHFFTHFIANSFLQLFVAGAVIIVFWSRKNATPGKMLFGMKIADATTLGTPSRKQYIIRYLGYVLAALPAGLGFLWILCNKKRQGWHDLLSNTVVIAKNPYDPADEDKKFRRQTVVAMVLVTLFALWFVTTRMQ